MNAALLVFLGGGIGSVLRYGVGRWLGPHAAGAIPWSTFAVNVLGSLCLGALVAYAANRELPDPMRTFLAVGILGGFTTYSSFNAETLLLFGQRGAALAGAYVLGTVAVCLAAGWCGGWIVHRALG